MNKTLIAVVSFGTLIIFILSLQIYFLGSQLKDLKTEANDFSIGCLTAIGTPKSIAKLKKYGKTNGCYFIENDIVEK